MRARALCGLLAASAVLALAGCVEINTRDRDGGGSADHSSAQHAEHNQADITFAQEMIPHHAQAIHLARMAQSRAQSPVVKALAQRIEAAQAPEIDTMTRWLEQWGAPVPATAERGPDGTGHGGDGMLSPEQMAQLGDASGAAFDEMFLHMMIAHHEGAIASARIELAEGQNPDAKQLAQQIINVQQAEIDEMRALLAQR